MNQSRIGQLNEKLNHSGINGAPVISDKELVELKNLLEEFRRAAEDYQDKPLSHIILLEIMSIERIIEARSKNYC